MIIVTLRGIVGESFSTAGPFLGELGVEKYKKI